MNPILSFVIILIGIYGISTSKNIIKSVVCLNIIQTGSILLFLNLGVSNNGDIPIITEQLKKIVDPIPQALMITTIVIGSTITALTLMLSIKIFHYYGTLNWKEVFDREV